MSDWKVDDVEYWAESGFAYEEKICLNTKEVEPNNLVQYITALELIVELLDHDKNIDLKDMRERYL